MFLPQNHLPVSIQSDKDKQQKRKGEQRWTAITNQWQRDANNRRKANGHADIDGNMEEENAGYPISIYPAESTSLSLGNKNDPEQQYGIQT